MDKGFIREIRAKPDRARGLFGSKSVADEVHEVAHILLQTWPQQVAAPIANEYPQCPNANDGIEVAARPAAPQPQGVARSIRP